MKLNKNKYWLYFIQAFFTVLAFCSAKTNITHEQALTLTDGANSISLLLAKLQLNYAGGYGVQSTLFVCILSYFFYHINKDVEKPNKRLFFVTSLGGALFSIFMIIGDKFIYDYSIFSSYTQVLITFINFVGYFFLFSNILIFLIDTTSKKFYYKSSVNKERVKKILKFKCPVFIQNFSRKHFVLFFAFVFLLFWLPYLIIFYPGTMNCDSLNEIHEFFRIIEWSSTHPILPTMVYGTFMNIGRFLIDDNFGLFLNNIAQVITAAFVLSYALKYTYHLTKSKKICCVIFAFFALFPTWPIHFYTEVKDIWFSLSFFVYIIFSMKFIELNGKLSKPQWIFYVLSMIFTYLFRNNGVFAILLSLPFLAIIVKKVEKIKIISFSLLAIIICVSFNKICATTLDIKKGKVEEMLSIPLQQTALYLNNYEVTDEEAETLDKLIPLDKFKDSYIPELSDGVKNLYRKSATTTDLKNYITVWFKMFFKHPNIYLKATLNSIYGYVYPNRMEYKDGIAQFTIDITGLFAHFNKANLDIHHLEKTAGLRDNIIHLTYTLRSMPFIGLFFSCGFYNWVLFTLTLILIYFKKKKHLVILVPLYINFLVCLASPVNSYVRYMLPIMLSLPFVMIWTLSNIDFSKKEI